MAKKRLFEVFDDMNQFDTENNTRLVEVTSNFISGNTVKQGAEIKMGVPQSSLIELMSDEKIAVLILVDREEYFKRSNQ